MPNKVKLIISYIVVSSLWLIATDNLIVYLNISTEVRLVFQNIKGFLFVLLTSFYIYYLISKKEAYENEKEETNKLNILINSMVDFVNFKDGEGRWTRANDFSLKLFQIKNIDYRGKKDSELAHYSEFYADVMRNCEVSDEEAWFKGEPSRYIEKFPTPDGSLKTFDTIKIPIFNKDGSRKELVVLGRDVSEKIAAEKKLAESEQRYKSLFEFNPELVYMIDLEGRLTNANNHFQRITGYQIEEYVTKKIGTLISEKNRFCAFKSFLKLVRHNQALVNKEIEIIRKDKKRSLLRVTAVPMIIDDRIVGLIGYAYDMTKERETEQMLRKTEKLSVVGELAASVAHEIRNPLTSLKGFVQLLQASNKENEYYYQIMLDELERMNIIASELLVLAKPQQIEFQKRNINELLQSVKSLLQSEANLHGVELELIENDQIPMIDCEPNQLKQLFINIMKNSIEAFSKKIQVKVKMLDHEKICIEFEDDGCGMDEERVKHLGEPFYSMKEKGTGLGLTVSYRIVEFHKGKIRFISKVDEGTTVELTLPIHK